MRQVIFFEGYYIKKIAILLVIKRIAKSVAKDLAGNVGRN